MYTQSTSHRFREPSVRDLAGKTLQLTSRILYLEDYDFPDYGIDNQPHRFTLQSPSE